MKSAAKVNSLTRTSNNRLVQRDTFPRAFHFSLQGSETITYCATSGKVKAGGGLFYRGKKHVEDMDQWLKSKAEGSKGLWEASARLVGIELS